jgi:hypothetical protein
VLGAPLDILDGLSAIKLVPSPIEVLGHGPKLHDEVSREAGRDGSSTKCPKGLTDSEYHEEAYLDFESMGYIPDGEAFLLRFRPSPLWSAWELRRKSDMPRPSRSLRSVAQIGRHSAARLGLKQSTGSRKKQAKRSDDNLLNAQPRSYSSIEHVQFVRKC